MCQRPDYETDAEELDRTLLVAFEQLKALTSLFLGEDLMKEVDLVEEFCSHAWDRLRELTQRGDAPCARSVQMNAPHAVD